MVEQQKNKISFCNVFDYFPDYYKYVLTEIECFCFEYLSITQTPLCVQEFYNAINKNKTKRIAFYTIKSNLEELVALKIFFKINYVMKHKEKCRYVFEPNFFIRFGTLIQQIKKKKNKQNGA